MLNNADQSIVDCLPKGDNPFISKWNGWIRLHFRSLQSRCFWFCCVSHIFVLLRWPPKLNASHISNIFRLITTWTSDHGNKIQMNQYSINEFIRLNLFFFFGCTLFQDWYHCVWYFFFRNTWKQIKIFDITHAMCIVLRLILFYFGQNET